MGHRFDQEFLQRIYITNYEQLHKFDVSAFGGIVLDESSILKNYEGKLKTLIIDSFMHTDYKLACTATPSPNDHMELGNHSEFLNIMSRSEMLAMFFVHDGGETVKWRLKQHAQHDFWLWLSAWGMCISKPSDLGFEDTGYILPNLNYHEQQIKTTNRNNGMLFNDVAVNATNFNQELRNTKKERISSAIEILKESNESFIIWCKQNEEADLLKKELIKHGITDFKEVRGNELPEVKESKLLGFAADEFRILITKSKIAQFGMNFQNCHNQIFLSLDFSFESMYQSVRRSYRFGQKSEVNIYLITTDTMQNVVKSIDDKDKRFREMQKQVVNATHDYYIKQKFMKTIDDSHKKEIKTDNYHIMQGDCVEQIKNLELDSVHLSIFSPPFADLYTYSDHIEDMGNSSDFNQFYEHFKFLIPELSRVIKPGRICAVHCMDLPIQKGKHGFIGLRDFSGLLIKAFTDYGFIYHARTTIWKNPVTEMQRTKALGLLHKQLKKDSVMSRTGIPDYVLFFRNSGENLIPIETLIPVDLWQKWA
ncbi:MAG: DNA methylase, partial [Candidatus Heimdallarchaeota archaeon]|nr:DNA methylase [Candidatus Heimdallarchaeota archaeon]